MAKSYLIPFTVDYDCYYKNEHGIPEDPKVINGEGTLTVYANDISEATDIAKKKLTGFVGDYFEIYCVSRGYNSPSNRRSTTRRINRSITFSIYNKTKSNISYFIL